VAPCPRAPPLINATLPASLSMDRSSLCDVGPDRNRLSSWGQGRARSTAGESPPRRTRRRSPDSVSTYRSFMADARGPNVPAEQP